MCTRTNFNQTLAESESYVTTDSQSTSLSWNKEPIWGLRPDSYYFQTVAYLLMWGALSDERTSTSFTIAAGLASGVILRPESRGTRDHILLSQILYFPFRRHLRLVELRWRYSTPPPHGLDQGSSLITSGRTARETVFQSRTQGNVYHPAMDSFLESIPAKTSLLSRCLAADGS
jgi:hypothetical protein